MKRVYLDHAATTPMRSEVLEAMLPYFRDKFGNASTLYLYGREAKKAIDAAREKVASVINADPSRLSLHQVARSQIILQSLGLPGLIRKRVNILSLLLLSIMLCSISASFWRKEVLK